MGERKPRRKKARIAFVCTGNTCRSVMAEYILRSRLKSLGRDEIIAESYGLKVRRGDGINPLAVTALKSVGIIARSHPAKALTRAAAERAALVVCMTRAQANFVRGDDVISFYDVIGQDIADPYGGDETEYESVATLLCESIDAVIAEFDRKNERNGG